MGYENRGMERVYMLVPSCLPKDELTALGEKLHEALPKAQFFTFDSDAEMTQPI